MIKLALAIGFLSVFGLTAYFLVIFLYHKLFSPKPGEDQKTSATNNQNKKKRNENV
jgi:hypothetical protein